MSVNAENQNIAVTLAPFGKKVSLAGAVPRTLSGSEAGRVVGLGCRSCVTEKKS